MRILLASAFIFINLAALAQADSSLNMDAVYNRPLSAVGQSSVSLGGYLEANWQHLGTDGVSEGHQLQARRLTLFMSSNFSSSMRFLTEIEFEEGGEEINIEFASVDVMAHPLLNFRAGIIMNPIGAFNQNHDGPKWEFTDRPLMADQMLAATWSNAGAGLYGKYYRNNWMFGYEAYVSGGFDNSIIDNEMGKTYLPSAKANKERFEEGPINTTVKIALAHSSLGELGLSSLFGNYQKATADGVVVNEELGLQIWAVDYNKVFSWGTNIITEFVYINVDLPNFYALNYGREQIGWFADIIQPVYTFKQLGPWTDTKLSAGLRLEYLDYNADIYPSEAIGGNEIKSIMGSLSLRPSNNTVLRLNYRYMEEVGFVRSPAALTGGFSLGFSTYF